MAANSLSILPPPSAALLSDALSGFLRLDERIANGTGGIVRVRVEPEARAALVAHLARRARIAGLTPIIGRGGSSTPALREVGIELGLPTDLASSWDPAAFGALVARKAESKRVAIFVDEPPAGSWDAAVMDQLPEKGALWVVLGDDGDFDVASVLTSSERATWLRVAAEDTLAHAGARSIGALESLWQRASALPRVVPLSPEGKQLAARMALLGRRWQTAGIARLGATEATLSELLAAGVVARDEDGQVRLADTCNPHASHDAPLEERQFVAGLLGAEPDPWALIHAASLLLPEQPSEAQKNFVRGYRMLPPAASRRDALFAWNRDLRALDVEQRWPLALAAAEAALDSGEYPAALELLGTAGHRRDAKTLLSWVRAYLGSGDLVAAETELSRVEASTLNPDDFWAAKVERAELLYKRGEFANVEALLSDIEAAPRSTRLRGRNTLGKVLLAQSKWDEADRHFADDAQEAAALGDIAGELRAQINRGIAHLSTGQMERAEQTFRRVLQEAEAHREHMLAVFAMANLAVVAMRTFRYGDALQFWERTVRLQHATRNPETTGRALANLAALRLRLGALSHAEHAIRFARRAFEGRGLAWLMTHLGTEMAGIALARGDIGEARQAIREALSKAKDSNKRGEAFALSARIALEDGDVHLAASELAKACELKTSDWTRAEIAIVRTLLARARGDAGQVELAAEAASFADAAHDEELRREALTVLAQALGDAGDLDGARRAIGEAVALRDRVAASLDTEQRAGYLAKPSVSGLTRLASLANLAEEDEAPKTIRSRVGPAIAEAPRTLIGDDPQMRALRGAIKKIAKTTTTVLVHGESGTGKELVAAALHAESERAQGPFVALNCAALAETLLLSELFGHERGAFTGAAARKRGRFEVAEGGTLFLDEIGDISPATQVALLRVLQEKTFERVGGTQSIRANVRIICATHRDLRGMVERGEFREDLYYRLRQVVLEVPALRQRPSDIAKLAQHLLERVAQERSEAPRTLDGDAAALLSRHRWPGNIRELENVLRSVSVFCESHVIGVADLVANVPELADLAGRGSTPPPPMSSALANPHANPLASQTSLSNASSNGRGDDEGDEPCGTHFLHAGEGPLPDGESTATQAAYGQIRQGVVSLHDMKRQIERDCIARALSETKGNITKAAALLGMKRPRLSQLVKQYGLAVGLEGQS